MINLNLIVTDVTSWILLSCVEKHADTPYPKNKEKQLKLSNYTVSSSEQEPV